MFEHFDRHTAEIGRARRLVRSSLESWGLEAHAGAVELVTSELVTNALVHGDGVIGLRLEARGHELRLEVTDAGLPSVAPRQTQSEDGSVGGWGLRLTAALSSNWGASTRPAQTLVWMVRRIDDPPLTR